MKLLPFIFIVALFVSVFASCSDDNYRYPSVKEDFFSLKLSENGQLCLTTDDGSSHNVQNVPANLKLKPDTLYRLFGYYEEQDNNSVKLYTPTLPISSLPVKSYLYADSVPTSPVIIQSAWFGYDYLNIVLNVLNAGGQHTFAFIEDSCFYNKAERVCNLSVSVYHNSHNDYEAYTNRIYMSLPLYPYLIEDVDSVEISLSVLNYEHEIMTRHFTYTAKQ